MTIKINNQVINGNVSGRNIIIQNGKVIINGKDVTPPDAPVINIEITGNVETLKADVCNKITINGTVKEVSNTAGDITTGDVSGNVSTASGDVKCGNVQGNVKTMSGDIDAKAISGSVSTMSGDIEYLGK